MLQKVVVLPAHSFPPSGLWRQENSTPELQEGSCSLHRQPLLSTPSVLKINGQHLASDQTSLFLVTFYAIYSIPVTTEYSCKCMQGCCCYKAAISWTALILLQQIMTDRNYNGKEVFIYTKGGIFCYLQLELQFL